MNTSKKGQAIETIHSFVYTPPKQSTKNAQRKTLKAGDENSSVSDQETFAIEKN